LDELGAHVLERVLQFDVLGDGDAVLGDVGRPPALVEDGVAAAGAEGAAHGAGELGGPGEEFLPGVVGVGELLGCHPRGLLWGAGWRGRQYRRVVVNSKLRPCRFGRTEAASTT